MNLAGKRLDEYLTKPPNAKGRTRLLELASLYESIVRRAGPVHDEVVAGALLAQAGINAVYLTGHGRDHVKRVIERASDLVVAREASLDPAEIFTLLVAIQAHDVGNIEGREKHEERISDLLPQIVGDDIPDALERNRLIQIVRAHGGEDPDGSKDRIGRLPDAPVPMFDGKVRLQFIAAILRFADELADDHTRSATQLLNRGLLPVGSEANHHYAAALKQVSVDAAANQVSLHFVVPPNLTTNTVGYKDRRVFLIDYIFERMEKMHLERLYCSRFLMRGGIRIDRIEAEILFLTDNGGVYHPPIASRMVDSGYPLHRTIDELCGDDAAIKSPAGLRWTGERLKESVEEQTKLRGRDA